MVESKLHMFRELAVFRGVSNFMAVFDDDGTETKSIRLLETFCFQFEKN
jgi:hypothetical protein